MVPTVLALWAALLFFYLSSDLQIDQLNMIGSMIKEGVVIIHRPETHLEYNDSYLSILHILLTRFVYFFAPFSNAWSTPHIAISALFFFVVALSVSVSLIFVDDTREKNKTALKARSILIFTILSVAVYHSMTFIDYDWRYRYPTIALMMLLAAVDFGLFLMRKPFGVNREKQK